VNDIFYFKPEFEMFVPSVTDGYFHAPKKALWAARAAQGKANG
jgi:hypothetical protein